MSFSHRISVTDQRALLDCGSLGQLTELQTALGSLLGEARFQSSFGLLVELGQDGPIVECTHALAVADALLPGQAVQVLTPLLPTPLLDALASRGMQTTVFALPTGGARVLIRYPGGDDAASA